MNNVIFPLVFLLICSSCSLSENHKPLNPGVDIIDHNFPDVTIRALDVINDSTVWFAGSKGVWGYTLNNGKDWFIDTLKIPNTISELRSIKITPDGSIYLVNVANPAALYKSSNQGQTWERVYSDTTTDAFFDAVNFWDNENGILLGDAMDKCFHFATTNDGGNTWKKVDCDSIPETLLNENPFAASNSNIALNGSSVWIPSGGKSKSRVYFSTNYGKSWNVSPTKVIWGETMTGIFSVDFLNDSIGVVAGGNWEDVAFECQNIAFTTNGGITWNKLDDQHNGIYISCVKYIPNKDGKWIIAMTGRGREGKSAIQLLHTPTKTWYQFENPKSYLAVKMADPNNGWVSGKNWIGKIKVSY